MTSASAKLRHVVGAGPIGRWTRTVRRKATIVRLTGRLHPDHIPLAASGHTIYVDPGDRRGAEIVNGLGRGHQPALIALWRDAIAAAHPALVIDVGANYGEFLLNARYPPEASAVGVEANPRIVPLLRRSVEAHPDAERITLHPVLAADSDGGEERLRVDPGWSGTAGASLDRSADGRSLVEVTVPVRTLDGLVASPWPSTPGGLVLKIDVEGSEWQVLGGATDLLHRAPWVVALVEFDPSHLRRSGTDPEDLFAVLSDLGRCWSVAWDGTRTAVTAAPTAPSDLLVVSDPALEGLLGL